MKNLTLLLLLTLPTTVFCQDKKIETPSPNTIQYYSGKFGFYNPSDGLNNGLLLGIDGITEFTHYNFILTGVIDLYPKQTIDIFENPQPSGGSAPNVTQQQMFLVPLHINVGYKFFEIPDADTKGYIGVGGGYYFYFYSATYQSSNGGLLGGVTSSSDSKNGGNLFGTLFARLLINKIFVEPRMYFAKKSEDSMGGNVFLVNPSGFAITLGFQYH